jgi:hypothetical protein
VKEMVKTEYFDTRSDGVVLNRTYSDIGKRLIRNDGVEYDEAIDVEGSGYTYTESEEDVFVMPEEDMDFT